MMVNGWLIENNLAGLPMYIAPNKGRVDPQPFRYWVWTSDAYKAIRFSRHQDAEQAWSVIRSGLEDVLTDGKVYFRQHSFEVV